VPPSQPSPPPRVYNVGWAIWKCRALVGGLPPALSTVVHERSVPVRPPW
jgi:hypothetical protein